MPEETTLEETIRRNASGPKSAEVDGQKVEQHSLADQIAADEYLASKKALKEQHSLADQIAADEYLASKKAVKSRTSGLKITKLCHSGA